MLESETRVSTLRKDYRVSNYLIDTSILHFEIDPEQTRVTAVHSVRTNPLGSPEGQLTLDGVDLELISIAQSFEKALGQFGIVGAEIDIISETYIGFDGPRQIG